MQENNSILNQEAHRYIPGGAHTYSRGDDQFPENAPKVLHRGSGAYVWDVDNRRFLDYGMALRSITIGYDYDRVSEAAIQEIRKGNNLTRATETEVLAAKEFCETIPGCDMVKFAKNGSNAVSAAVKLARAYTGKNYILRCGQHPFFSFDDWFIGDTEVSRGVPESSRNFTLRFNFNDISSVKAAFAQYGNQIACVILEPATSVEPMQGFLSELIAVAHQNKSLVILDEMITGFRWSLKGASDYYGVMPDLKTFGKGMANGFSVAAVAGRRDIMEIGGIHHDQERVFLVSTTHGAEMCGLGAFRETLRVYKELDVTSHLWNQGERLKRGLNGVARDLGISEQFSVEGPACSPAYLVKDADGAVSMSLRTLFMQEMVKNGVLMPWIALSLSHGEEEIDMTIAAAEKSLRVVKNALESGTDQFLIGKAVKPVFRKYN
ncbi:glutamate-1-semialdehyde 2,1-aminomutase [Oligoflexus tunisiensis]|uniref:glutamate-1-semialdehyde 2,1-aminomutase n=1 Tax=Oligoflexus tunisiensis TaxID=708132 RepID=UPI000A80B71C|nr:glutamate-1-semialdehyde 2,1-aminomutase [Oligoflexus tunisiensis]